MTEVHQYWINLKEPVLVVVDSVEVSVAAVVVEEVLEGADLVWEDYSRLECQN